MTRATDAMMDALHSLVAGALKDELQAAIDLSKHEDEEKRQPINPQLIDKALKFLKDNQITAPASSTSTNDLAETLSNLDVDLGEESARLIN